MEAQLLAAAGAGAACGGLDGPPDFSGRHWGAGLPLGVATATIFLPYDFMISLFARDRLLARTTSILGRDSHRS